jgi:hypothetical protein
LGADPEGETGRAGVGTVNGPLCIDLFCGLGGWSEGFIAEGYQVIGFDIERHDYGAGGYPGQLVLQDVHTLHGSQFRGAACIVASPPCQEFSYMAMPWSRAKQIGAALRMDVGSEFPEGYTGSRTIAELTALFDACFRIQREASEAAGRHIPMVVENVKGAQPWVGRAQANYGSFYLWGDVRSVGGRIVAAHQVKFGAPAVRAYRQGAKVPGMNWSGSDQPGYKAVAFNGEAERRPREGQKVSMNFHEYEKTGKPGRSFQSAAVEHQKQPVWFNDDKRKAVKCGGDWFGSGADCSLMRNMGSKSSARKAASAQIARIPYELARFIAKIYHPMLEFSYEETGDQIRNEVWTADRQSGSRAGDGQPSTV